MEQSRATWLTFGTDPTAGTMGTCWPAGGFSDPESAEEGAYLFQPDGEDYAVYCDPKRDIEIEPGTEQERRIFSGVTNA